MAVKMIQKPFFSIIIVCLNPGHKLGETLESITMQTCQDYEVVIKDGQSSDGVLEAWEKENSDSRIRVYKEKDKGIYDAMNQAVTKASGRFIYFLNCGDLFFDEKVLAKVREKVQSGTDRPQIIYGNIFETLTGQQVASNPHLDRFGCYRNVPCHQACFYEKDLLIRHPFEIKYRVRADYEQFLWCALEEQAQLTFMPATIAYYEGGGFSETAENRKRSAHEHKEIAERYMKAGELFKYRAILLLTLAPLRTRLAENAKTAAFYNRIKSILYKNRTE